MAHVLGLVLPWLLVVLVGLGAWKLGRKWRGQFKGAQNLRAKLQADSDAYAALTAQLSSTATASGNVVHVTVGADGGVVVDGGDSGPGAFGGAGVLAAGAFHAGLTGGDLDRPALLNGSDDCELPNGLVGELPSGSDGGVLVPARRHLRRTDSDSGGASGD